MTLRLILMRHAKSSWDDLSLSDHDRPLNGRGRASAKAVGDWLRTEGHIPTHALCSTAARTVETLERSGLKPDPRYLKGLYHAGPERILDEIRTHGQGAVLLVVCHNPGIAEFAERIVAQAPAHPRFFDYPTAATLVAEFDTDSWEEVRFGTGQVIGFTVPRDLIQ